MLQNRPIPSLWRYASNRLLRIAPAYVVIFLAATFIVGTVYIRGSTHGLGPDNIGRLTDPGAVIANLLLIQTYIPPYVMSGLGVSWSLTAEVAFYVVLPLAVIFAGRLVDKRVPRIAAMAVVPAVMIIVGLSITVWSKLESRNLKGEELSAFEWGQTSSAVLLRSFLAQADLFAYGMLTALAVAIVHDRGVAIFPARVSAALLGVAAALTVGAITVLHPLVSSVAGVASAFVIVAVVLPSRTGGANFLARFLEWLPLRFVGLVSYSLYLWHLPVVLWLVTQGPTVEGQSLAAKFGLVLLIAIPLSAATYYLVERPAMRRKKRDRIPDVTQQHAAV